VIGAAGDGAASGASTTGGATAASGASIPGSATAAASRGRLTSTVATFVCLTVSILAQRFR
jgi:hypothetical protein